MHLEQIKNINLAVKNRYLEPKLKVVLGENKYLLTNYYFKNQFLIVSTLGFIVSISHPFASADYIVYKYLLFMKIIDFFIKKTRKTYIKIIQLARWTFSTEYVSKTPLYIKQKYLKLLCY